MSSARCLLTAVVISAPLVSGYLPASTSSSSSSNNQNLGPSAQLISRRRGLENAQRRITSDASLSYAFRDITGDASETSANSASARASDELSWGDLLAGGAYVPVSSPFQQEQQQTIIGISTVEVDGSADNIAIATDNDNKPRPNKSTGPKISELRRRTDEVLSGGSTLLSSERKRNRTYGWLLDSWCGFYSSESDAPDRAADLLIQMESEVPHLVDARAYTKVISAYAKSCRADAGEVAESILRRMNERGVAPNAFVYNSVIHSWASSGDYNAPARAEALLQDMEMLHDTYAGEYANIKPTTVSFNAVIDCLAKTGGGENAKRAEELLRRMEELYESGVNIDAKPNVRSFNSVINAWAKSGTDEAALRAEAILDLMERLSNEGNQDVRPDVVAFATVINAWGRSQRFGKAERVLNIYRHMKELTEAGNDAARPNIIIYNSILNACAFSVGDLAEQNRAVEIAHYMLKELELGTDGDPDQITYGTFLKVCLNQMADSDTRRKVAALIFKNAQRDGQVGTMVLQHIRLLAPPDMYYDLVGRRIDENIGVDDLPAEWRCNVVEGKWRRRRRLLY